MPQVDIITGEARHRTWTLEDKLSILEAAFAPGAVVAHVARRVNITTGQLYTWRQQLMRKKPAGGNGFAQVVAVTDGPSVSSLAEPARLPTSAAPPMTTTAADLPAIEIETRGHKVRIPATMPAALAAAVVRALVRR
jgi:transposase